MSLRSIAHECAVFSATIPQFFCKISAMFFFQSFYKYFIKANINYKTNIHSKTEKSTSKKVLMKTIPRSYQDLQV